MRVNFNLNKPIYLQIIDEFKRAIARRDIEPGQKLPSQRELAKELKVNPNTVQKAYQEMERCGLVETLRGQGTFVKKDESLYDRIRNEMAANALKKFLEEMQSLGFENEEIFKIINRKLQT